MHALCHAGPSPSAAMASSPHRRPSLRIAAKQGAAHAAPRSNRRPHLEPLQLQLLRLARLRLAGGAGQGVGASRLPSHLSHLVLCSLDHPASSCI